MLIEVQEKEGISFGLKTICVEVKQTEPRRAATQWTPLNQPSLTVCADVTEHADSSHAGRHHGHRQGQTGV